MMSFPASHRMRLKLLVTAYPEFSFPACHGDTLNYARWKEPRDALGCVDSLSGFDVGCSD